MLNWEGLEIVVRGLQLFLVEEGGPVPDVGREGKGWGEVFREGVRVGRGES